MPKPDHASLYWQWDAEAGAMYPLTRFAERAKSQFADKGIYRLQTFDQRTTGSHNHYFASLNAAWKNLPENHRKRFPTLEHFRKWLLIKCGYYTVAEINCATPEDVVKLVTKVKFLDPYAVVIVAGLVVAVYTAESQSHAAMDKQTFQASKRAVLDEAAAMIGVTTDELIADGKRHPDYEDYEGYGT